jgi:hypothetical protein
MRRSLIWIAVAVVAALAGCRSQDQGAKQSASETPTTLRSRAIDPPAAPGSMAPQLRNDRDGVLATWLEPDGDAQQLVWSRWNGSAWTKPQVISAGTSILANWADVPSIARGNDGALVAHWAETREGGKYAYDAVVARSTDGVTWKRLGPLHDDATPTEHGFVSLVADGASMRAFWLDGRATSNGGAMTLRTASVGEAVGPSTVVDDRVCDCCSTAVTATKQGVVVAYRDRSTEEIRDIAIARTDAASWSVANVARDNWEIDGCPVNGPAIASDGQRVVVAWYTLAGNIHRVRAAISDDAGRTFGPPIEIDAGQGERSLLGRVGVVIDVDGTAIVSWLAASARRASLLLRRISADGRGREVVIGDTTADREAGFPRIAREGDALIVMWTETASPKRLRASRLATSDVPAVPRP